jgi:hypothetical protein
MDPRALTELFPNWKELGAPLITPVTADEFLFLSKDSAVQVPNWLLPQCFKNEGNYIISLANVTRWLGQQAENLGVEIFPGFPAAEILYNGQGAVCGVITGCMGLDKEGQPTDQFQLGMELRAKYTLFAEGSRGNLGKELIARFALDADADPQSYALGIKELWEVEPAQSKPGLVVHTAGWPLKNDTYGGSFLYHLGDNKAAVGFVVVGGASAEGIPDFVRYAFFIGAGAILVSIAVTVLTTKEYPPEDMEEFRLDRKKGFREGFQEIVDAFRDMPVTMRQLWWVKFFTWYALPLMWQYLALSIARHCFNAPNTDSPGFEEGVRWGNMGLAVFNIACFGVSFLLVAMAKKTSSRLTHAICLVLAGIGFVSMLFTTDVYMVMACMALVGIGWASIMSMPYVMLSTSVPESRMGVYMGIFNMFIVVPQIINMITIPLLYKPLLGNDPRNALAFAGVLLFFAAASCFRVKATV